MTSLPLCLLADALGRIRQNQRDTRHYFPFLVDLDGSSSGSATIDDSQIATDEEIDTLLDDVFGNQGGSTVDDSQIATDEEIDQLLDDIFG